MDASEYGEFSEIDL